MGGLALRWCRPTQTPNSLLPALLTHPPCPPAPSPHRYRDQGGRDRSDLNSPATWELYVEMRFTQLRTACDLELWAEAFRRCVLAGGAA